MTAFMGIDVGTGSTKVELLTDDGVHLHASSASYVIDSARPGWAEQHPEIWWQAVSAAVTDVLAKADLPRHGDLRIGLTGQMHSTVLVDAALNPVRSAILWCDERARPQAMRLNRAVPDLSQVTGNPPLPAFTSTHLAWLRENEPHTLERAAHLLLPKDYIRQRLLGSCAESHTDWTDASATGMLDIRTKEWSSRVVDAVGIGPDLLPVVHDPRDIAGEVTSLIPSDLNAQVVYGVGDQFAEAASVGLERQGPLVIVLGTSGVLLGVTETPGEGMFCHIRDNSWLRLDSMHAAGMSLTWLQHNAAPHLTIPDLMEIAETIPAGSEGLVFLPFLAGDRQLDESGLPGGFLGLKASHGIAHMTRAVLEGVAMELRRISEQRMSLPPPDHVVIKGGGAQSRLWGTIFSQVFTATVQSSSVSAAFGALRIAGQGVGETEMLMSPQITSSAVINPDEQGARAYEDIYGRYVSLVSRFLDDSGYEGGGHSS